MLLSGAVPHASFVARVEASPWIGSASAERARPKVLRRESVPAVSSAMRLAATLTRIHVQIHSSTRRLAKMLHVGKSRAHSLCDAERPESISLADLLVLGLSSGEEGRAIVIGILRDLAEYVGLAADIERAESEPSDAQLSLFAEAA